MFWQKLSKPFMALAPMDDVTDVVFREIVAQTARPDVFFTEFTNVEALVSAGREVQLQRLLLTDQQHPIVAQLWGREPEHYAAAAKVVASLGFDGIDINMGCPDRKVMKNGAGAALIGASAQASEIIEAVKEGAGGLPVSVKTRLGIDQIKSEDWTAFLFEQGIAALTVHLRTVEEMSRVPVHWTEMAKIAAVRQELEVETVILGNGDVADWQQAQTYAIRYGIEGIMIGRGVLNNIRAFDKSGREATRQEKIDLLRRHIALWLKTWGKERNFAAMKKFYGLYISNFSGANQLRQRLMDCYDLDEVLVILAEVI